MTTATKEIWHAEGNQIFEGDKLIGTYESPKVADIYVLLHNQHQSGNHVLSQIDLMYASGINFMIKTYEYGISWAIDENTFGTEPTFEETLIAMRNAARAAYPKSVFARGHGYDMELQTDQRTVEDLASELGKFGEFELNYDPTDPDPYTGNWTCTINGKSFAGYTAIEVLKFATESTIADRATDDH